MASSQNTPPRTLRAIAIFEAFKGTVALAACFGFLGLLHQDLHQMAASLIGHIGLNPGDRYPALVLSDIDRLLHTDLTSLLMAAFAYVTVRFLEAYGLWRERAWGEWLGASSGALYVPFELRHFLHSPTATSALVMAANIAVVIFLGWQLRQRRPASPG